MGEGSEAGRGPRYLGRCLVGPSGVPGHRDLSSGLHPHPLLLLRLLLLQDRARERTHGVRGGSQPEGAAHATRPARLGSAGGLPAGDCSQEWKEGPLCDPPQSDSGGASAQKASPSAAQPQVRTAGPTRTRRGQADERDGMLHAHAYLEDRITRHFEHRRVSGQSARERGPPNGTPAVRGQGSTTGRPSP